MKFKEIKSNKLDNLDQEEMNFIEMEELTKIL